MKAMVVERLDGPEAMALRDVPIPEGAHPEAAGRRLLIEVHAAGLCFPDVLQTRGAYQHGVAAPFVSGGEVAGIVSEAPEGSGFRPGDRVAGLVIHGAMAEFALGLPDYTIHLPEHVPFDVGAAIYLNYSTAWFALDRAGARPEDVVLVHGAAGGVGTAALDLLRDRGMRAIATVSSAEKERVARAMGATDVVRTDGDWLAAVRELTGGNGVDIVLDPVGGDRFTDSLRSLQIGGRLVVIGFAAGSIPSVKVNRLLLRNLTVLGIALEPFERRYPGTVRLVSEAIEDLVTEGRLKPLIDRRLPLDQGAEALRVMERREAMGKVVVDVR